jgi:hypothetical protein
MTRLLSFPFLKDLILFLTVFTWLFPSLRMLTIGSAEMKNFSEAIVTLLPDIILLCVLILGFVMQYRQSGKMGLPGGLKLFDKIFIAFFVSNVVLGIVLSMEPKLIAHGFRITYLPMLFYFIGRIYMGQEAVFGRLLHGIFFWFGICAVVGLVIYFGFRDFNLYMVSLTGYVESEYFIPRMSSILWTPVLFGAMMAFGGAYAYYQMGTRGHWLSYALFTVFVTCLFLTVSRGPIIAFLGGFIILTLIIRKWKVMAAAVLLVTASISLIIIIIPESASTLKWIFTSTGDTITLADGVSRVNRWEVSFADFRERPWGYGLGKAGATAFRFLRDSDIPSAPYTTDGWLLKMACETGVYGLLSYLVMCGIYFFQAVKEILKQRFSFITLAIAFFLMVNAQLIVSNTLDFHPYITIYWLVIGYSVNFFPSKK